MYIHNNKTIKHSTWAAYRQEGILRNGLSLHYIITGVLGYQAIIIILIYIIFPMT